MSIDISNLSFKYKNHNDLFSGLNLSISQHRKVSIIGNNGSGKSTLLKLMAKELEPVEGNIKCSSQPYYIPQQILCNEITIADALCVKEKLKALESVMGGSLLQSDYDTLSDDWDIEVRCKAALDYWQLPYLELNSKIGELSGGEKTKVFLAGILIHNPEIILLDEPTNHLDLEARELLYNYIKQTKSFVVVVSHDIKLLNLVDCTYELSSKGIKLYGGNYSFYKEQKYIEESALDNNIHEEEKKLRQARKKAQEVNERQNRRENRGEKNKDQLPRICRRTMAGWAQNTGAKLREKHSGIIDENKKRLSDLRQQQTINFELKIDFNNADLHNGKLLVAAYDINYSYGKSNALWKTPLSYEIFSGDRLHLKGNNGSGKTSLIKIITGYLIPQCGEIKRADFSYIYLDQEYSQVNVDLSVLKLAEYYNVRNLKEHEVKIRLNRALFPVNTWDKKCIELSGGEKMRLYLCCLMISNQIPDMIILDEPTNNLDIASLNILKQTISNYNGSLIVISHDEYFVNEIKITKELVL